MRRIILSLIFVILILPILTLAANDPGHDPLYIEQEGDSRLNGTLNITSNISIQGGRTTLSGLNLYGDGTNPTPGNPLIAAVVNDMYFDAQGNIYFKSNTGGDTLFIGTSSGRTDLNVSGNAFFQTNLNITTNLNVGGAGYIAGSQICTVANGACTVAGGLGNVTSTGSANYIPLFTSGTNIINSVIYQTSGRIGISTNAPSQALDVNGSVNITSNAFINGSLNVSGTIFESGNRVCTAANGFCAAVGGNGNVSSIASTGYIPFMGSINILNNSQIYQNGSNIGIGRTTPQDKLHVDGMIRTENVDWAISNDFGAGNDTVQVLVEYNGRLFAGFGDSQDDADIWEYNTTTSAWNINYNFGSEYGAIRSAAVYNGKLYVGFYNATAATSGADVWEYNGTEWILNNDFGAGLEGVFSLVTYNEKLYAGLGETAGDGDLWEYNGTGWAQTYEFGASIEQVRNMVVYNGKLYLTTGVTAVDGDIWEYNGINTTLVNNFGVYEILPSAAVYNGKLYFGHGTSAGSDANISVFDGTRWESNKYSFAGLGYDAVWALATYNGRLYAGLGTAAGEGDLFVFDGNSWQKVFDGGAGAETIQTLAAYNGKLYAGLGTGTGDADIYVYSEKIESQLSKEYNPSEIPYDEQYHYLTKGLGVLGIVNVSDNITAKNIYLSEAGYVSGSAICTAGNGLCTTSAGGWIDNSTNVTLSTATDNVGIGVNDPDARLGIRAANRTLNQIELRSADAAIVANDVIGGIDFKSDDTQLTNPGTNVASIQALAEATHTTTVLTTGLAFKTTTGTSFSEAMRIAGNNNIGIGITAPTALLHLSGYQQADVATATGTAAGSVLTTTGGLGGNTTIATTGTGGIGGTISITGGTGGVAATATTASTGGAGGSLSLAGGTGGVGGSAAGDGTTGTGGAGGATTIASGTGGATINPVSGTSTGGAGGAFTITIGTGGAANGGAAAHVGGAAGTFTMTGGVGGAALGNGTTNAGGAGSAFTWTAGTGGAALGFGSGVNTAGAGGAYTLTGGTGGAANNSPTNNIGGAGGAITIAGGTGGIGTNASGAGGLATLRGGTAASGNGSAGGAVAITGSAGTTIGDGGAGGAVTITGGAANGDQSVARTGGTITLTAGASRGSAVGGAIAMTAGAGGETPDATGPATGPAGGGMTRTLGAGGTAPYAETLSTGGIGGAYTITGGTGGAAAAEGKNNTGGAGSAINFAAGAGGTARANTDGTNTGGAGGAIALTIGTGALANNGTGAHVGGAGGAYTITGGAGGLANGNGTTNQGGVGSAFTWSAGTGGAATASGNSGANTAGAGGAITITSGTGGAANLGPTTNVGGAGGAITVAGGTGGVGNGSSGAGGLATLRGGTAAAGNGSAGGAVAITGSAGSTTGNGGAGGAVTITAGAAGGAINEVNRAGGTIALTAGASVGPTQAGGAITFTTGAAGLNNATGTNTGPIGGAVSVTMGTGGTAPSSEVASTGGTGGTYTITGGVGGTAAVAGTGSNTGGAGSAFTWTTGTGGAATGATSGANLGGAGGAYTLTGGTGGAATTSTSANTGGQGGNVTIKAGTGGAGTAGSGVGNGGQGGGLYLDGGLGGASTGGTVGPGGPIIFRTANTTTLTEKARFSRDGMLGIGTANPSSTLHVVGNATITTNLSIGVAGFIAGSQICTAANGVCTAVGGNGNLSSVGTANYIPLFQNAATVNNSMITQYGLTGVGISVPSPTATLQINSSNNNGALWVHNNTGYSFMFINATTANVGIGTAKPNATLHVIGTINASVDICIQGTNNICLTQALANDTSIAARQLADNITINTNISNIINRINADNTTINTNISNIINRINADNTTLTTAIASKGNVSSVGTAGYIPVFNNGTTLNNSALYQSGSSIGLGDATPTEHSSALIVRGGTTGARFNATYLVHSGVNFDSDVYLMMQPRDNGLDLPIEIGAVNAAGDDPDFVINVPNSTTRITNSLYIDGASQGVGIGDGTPDARLKIQNTVPSNNVFRVTDISDNILLNINNTGTITTGSSARLGIGTGTTDPTQGTSLEVKGGVNSVLFNATILRHAGTGVNSDVALSFMPLAQTAGVPSQIIARSPTGTFHYLDFLLRNSTDLQEIFMRMDGNAKTVSIGTTTSKTKLYVDGAINVSTGNDICIEGTNRCLSNAGSGGGNVSSQATTGYIPFMGNATTLNNSVIFQTGGNIGIGTIGPIATLQINSSNTLGSLWIHNTTGATQLFVNGTTGSVGIGTTAIPSNSKLYVNGTQTANDTTFRQIYSQVTINPTGPNAPGAIGIKTYVQRSASANNFTTSVIGVSADAENYGTGNVTQIIGTSGWAYNLNSTVTVNNVWGIAGSAESDSGNVTHLAAIEGWSGVYGGAVTNLYGLYILGPNIGGGTVTNKYGIYLSAGETTATNNYGIYQAGSGNRNYFAGNVGIGTTGPVSTLQVNSSNAAGSLWIHNTTGATQLFVNGTTGNVGIGTNTPTSKLEVKGGTATSDATIDGIALSTSNTSFLSKGRIGSNYNALYISQNMYYNGTAWRSIDNISAAGVMMWLSTLNGDSSINFGTTTRNNTFPSQRMKIDQNGNIGINTTTPSSPLHVVGTTNLTGRLFVGQSTFGNTTAVAVFADGIGKIDVGVIDPVYNINGSKYATYMAAMIGMKEETTGTLELNCVELSCSKTIDFDEQEQGSDLWLFSKTTNLKNNLNKSTVILTPSFEGKVWYKKDQAQNKITIFATLENENDEAEVSYRLTAPRFDYEQWKNHIPESTTGGYKIDE